MVDKSVVIKEDMYKFLSDIKREQRLSSMSKVIKFLKSYYELK